MGLNLAKTPLTAVFLASLLYFTSAALIPWWSQPYSDAVTGFVMPMIGYGLMLAFGLWISVAVALAFDGMRDNGALSVIMLFLSCAALVWFLPLSQQIFFGETTVVMSRTDLLFLAAQGTVCTAVLLILSAMLFGKKEAPPKPGMPPKPQPVYKLKTLGVIIRLLVLPFIYCVLYFVAWYFLIWKNDTVRLFYGGPGAVPGFTVSMIDLLTTNPIILPFTLMKGLAYALFALPLLMRMPEKRVLYVAVTVMLFLSDPIRLLIPSPLIQDDVRVALLINNAALLGVYGIICAVLLHLSYNKQGVTAKTPHTVPQSASARASASDAVLPGITAKNAADAVKSTMTGNK